MHDKREVFAGFSVLRLESNELFNSVRVVEIACFFILGGMGDNTHIGPDKNLQYCLGPLLFI